MRLQQEIGMLKWRVATTKQLVGDSGDGLASSRDGLQDMMQELQQGFTEAMAELCVIQDKDRTLHDEVEWSKLKQQEQIKDIASMVQSLKVQFDIVQSQMCQASEGQRALASQVRSLQKERRALLREVVRASELRPSAIAAPRRCKSCITEPDNSSSGDHDDNMEAKSAYSSSSYASRKGSIATTLSLSQSGESSECSSLTARSFAPTMYEPTPAELQDGQDVVDGHSSRKRARERAVSLALEARGGETALERTSNALTQVFSIDSDDQSSMTSGWSDGSKDTSRSLSTRLLMPQDKCIAKQVHRISIMNGLLESEKKYCNSLLAIVQHYAEPLTAAIGYISAEDASIVFPASLSVINDFHCTLVNLLEERMRSWKYLDVIGDIFARFAEPCNEATIFAVYSKYISEFPKAVLTIKKLLKHSMKFRKWVKKRQRKSLLELDLADLLLVPVRRVPSYISVLQKLLQCTEPDHPDAFYLKSCLARFDSAVRDMNGAIVQSVSLARVGFTADDLVSSVSEDMAHSLSDVRDTRAWSNRVDKELLAGAGTVHSEQYCRSASHNYADAARLSGLVTIPRKFTKQLSQQTDSSRRTSKAYAAEDHSNDNLIGSTNVSSQSQGHYNGIATLPKNHRLSGGQVVLEGSNWFSQESSQNGVRRIDIVPLTPGSSERVTMTHKPRSYHSSQFDLRYGSHLASHSSMGHKSLFQSQPNLLAFNDIGAVEKLHRKSDASAKGLPSKDANPEKKTKRRGLGVLLKLFFTRRLQLKVKANSKKAAVDSSKTSLAELASRNSSPVTPGTISAGCESDAVSTWTFKPSSDGLYDSQHLADFDSLSDDTAMSSVSYGPGKDYLI